jgi:hypothetical protein
MISYFGARIFLKFKLQGQPIHSPYHRFNERKDFGRVIINAATTRG